MTAQLSELDERLDRLAGQPPCRRPGQLHPLGRPGLATAQEVDAGTQTRPAGVSRGPGQQILRAVLGRQHLPVAVFDVAADRQTRRPVPANDGVGHQTTQRVDTGRLTPQRPTLGQTPDDLPLPLVQENRGRRAGRQARQLGKQPPAHQHRDHRIDVQPVQRVDHPRRAVLGQLDQPPRQPLLHQRGHRGQRQGRRPRRPRHSPQISPLGYTTERLTQTCEHVGLGQRTGLRHEDPHGVEGK
jgi:hypothetical protein